VIHAKGRRRLTCYHEAGHILARWYLGHLTESLNVLTALQVRSGGCPINRRGRTSECEGHCRDYETGPQKLETPETLQQSFEGAVERATDCRCLTVQGVAMAMVDCLVGLFAEARIRHCSAGKALVTGGTQDYANFRHLRDTSFAEDALAGKLAWDQTAALIRSGHGWRAIEAIAAPLYKTGELDDRRCAELCAEAYGVSEHPGSGAVMEAWPIAPATIRAGWLRSQPKK
jgi:hypothetical protein